MTDGPTADADRTPGAGRATSDRLLGAGTAMGPVTLHVGDLPAMVRYYRDVLTLEVVEQAGGRVALGRTDVPLVVLQHTPGLPRPARGTAGLFHTAVLFGSRAALAHALATAVRTAPASYVGSADHLVSLAFYLTDPEGNGVELYWDRPREAWSWSPHGVAMDNLPLDPDAFVAAHLPDDAAAADPAAVVGHVHLQVGDLEVARRFYVDVLGFTPTADWPGALFVAAGGYHHHMAVNTWGTRGAGPRAASLGLGEVRITVPSADDLAALAARLHHHRVPVADDGRELRLRDPWDSEVVVGTAA